MSTQNRETALSDGSGGLGADIAEPASTVPTWNLDGSVAGITAPEEQTAQMKSALPQTPDGWAFFLDLDGTLLDLASTPDAVQPAPGLFDALRRLEDETGGALAIVTGRAIEFVDALFTGHHFTVAGLHGAALRVPGDDIQPAERASAAYSSARDFAQAQAKMLPGVLFEDKGQAFALHYRLAPLSAVAVADVMKRALVLAGPAFMLRPGKSVVELCPAGHDKGSALRYLMTRPPFYGRKPLAAGDDLTDEAMFPAASALGGLGVRVGPLIDLPRSGASLGLPTPASFRDWIRRLTR